MDNATAMTNPAKDNNSGFARRARMMKEANGMGIDVSDQPTIKELEERIANHAT